MNVGLKYCGCCNPQIDLGRIAAHLAQAAKNHGFSLVPFSENNPDIDILVILCGCPRACANKPEYTDKASFSLVVAGQYLNGVMTSEAELPAAVEVELTKA